MNPGDLRFNSTTIMMLVDTFVLFGIGSYLLWRHGRRIVARRFGVALLFGGGYNLWGFGICLLPDPAVAITWWRVFLPVGALFLASALHFAVEFSGSQGPRARQMLAVVYTTAAVLGLLSLSRQMPITMTYLPEGRWFPSQEPVYYYGYIPLLAVCMGVSLVLVGKRWIVTRAANERNQLGYFFVALVAGLACSVAGYLLHLDVLGQADVLVFMAIMAYAITQNNLFDLSRIFSRSAMAWLFTYAGLVALVAGLHFFLFTALRLSTQSSFLISAFLASLVVLGVFPLRQAWGGVVERFFEVKQRRPSERLLEFAGLLGRYPRLPDYLCTLAVRLAGDMDLRYMALLTRERATGRFSTAARHPEGLVGTQFVDPASPLFQALEAGKAGGLRMLDYEGLQWDGDAETGCISPGLRTEAAQQMAQLGAAMAVPIEVGDHVEALMLLGPRASGGLFTVEDREFLQTLASQVATALENAGLAEQVQQADRLSLLGTMAASMAHEIRNPLTSMSLFVQMLPERHNQPEFRERFQNLMGEEIRKLNRLTEQLLTFARAKPHDHQPVGVNGLAERAFELLRFQFLKKGVVLEQKLSAPAAAKVMGDEAQLSQVMINLLLNALQATEEGGRVSLATSVGPDGWVAFRISDTGCGMTPEQAGRVFEPFFTTKESGTGLGLATCQRVAMEHAGGITVKSAPGRGSEFVLRLPSAPPDFDAEGDNLIRLKEVNQ